MVPVADWQSKLTRKKKTFFFSFSINTCYRFQANRNDVIGVRRILILVYLYCIDVRRVSQVKKYTCISLYYRIYIISVLEFIISPETN